MIGLNVKKRAKMGKALAPQQFLLHGLLIVGALVSLFPFYWLVVMSTNTASDIFKYPPRLIFGSHLLINIAHVLSGINFFGAFANTVFVASCATVLILFFCSLAGFTFAKFTFRGQRILFVILLLTMMLPTQMSAVPSFVIMAKLGWVNSFKALVVPGMANAFGIFWMRQYARSAVPSGVIDAGRIDGCGHLRL